jgi:UDP-glucuronate decarboxylase
MKNAQDVIHEDLNYIIRGLRVDLSLIAGKKLLITGGAGFLGYYLIQAILFWNRTVETADRVQITVYDNYIRGVPQWLLALEGNENLILVNHNIINPLPYNIDDFQYIIHAAGIASPTYYRSHPIETMDANVLGLRNLLDYARKQKEENRPVEGFLFFSSSEIYGDPDPANIPTPESYRGNVSCTGPRACYDESKRYSETLCVNFAQQFGLPIKVARPFNNYGPGLKISDRRVIPDFARDIFDGKDIVMLSDGTPKRTFCYAADAIIGYYKILLSGSTGEAYNIGVEGPEISMAELADRVVSIARDLFEYRGKVVHQASSQQARAHLDYNPTISLDEGLRRSLLWYSDNRVSEDA